MITLKGNTVYLRALEPEDLEFVYAIENDESIWEISNTQTPYSRFLIRQYLENAQQDIYEAKQLRLAICKNENDEVVGLIDLFDFDPRNKRAGVGIVIQKEKDRNISAFHMFFLVFHSNSINARPSLVLSFSNRGLLVNIVGVGCVG